MFFLVVLAFSLSHTSLSLSLSHTHTHTHTQSDVIIYKLHLFTWSLTKLYSLWDYLKWKSGNIGELVDIPSVNIQRKILNVDRDINPGSDSFSQHERSATERQPSLTFICIFIFCFTCLHFQSLLSLSFSIVFVMKNGFNCDEILVSLFSFTL